MDLEALGAFRAGTGLWLDPARRTPGRTTSTGATRRVSDPESFAPPWSFVRSLAARNPATGVKLPPGIAHRYLPDPAAEPVELQWVSVGGEAVECSVWWGGLARDGVGRSALVLGPDSAAELREPRAEARTPASAGLRVAPASDVRPGTWLHEPDPAVVSAGLVPLLAEDLDAAAVSKGPTYLVGPVPAASPFARTYAVEDVLPFQLKSLRAYLRDRDVGRLTVKKRGVSVDPEQLRRQLRPTGDGGGDDRGDPGGGSADGPGAAAGRGPLAAVDGDERRRGGEHQLFAHRHPLRGDVPAQPRREQVARPDERVVRDAGHEHRVVRSVTVADGRGGAAGRATGQLLHDLHLLSVVASSGCPCRTSALHHVLLSA